MLLLIDLILLVALQLIISILTSIFKVIVYFININNNTDKINSSNLIIINPIKYIPDKTIIKVILFKNNFL